MMRLIWLLSEKMQHSAPLEVLKMHGGLDWRERKARDGSIEYFPKPYPNLTSSRLALPLHSTPFPCTGVTRASTTKMAPTTKDGEKEAKLTTEQSASVIMDYLRKQNRPYSAQTSAAT
jgi:hypothetical protein